MRSRIVGAIVILALFQLMGIPTAHAVRIVTATETFLPEPANANDTILTDSVVGELCTANENSAACLPGPYPVDAGFLYAPPCCFPFETVGVQLLDPHGSAELQGCTGSNVVGDQCVSDQLFLRASPNSDGSGTVQWCWDSDLETGSVNVCQENSAFHGIFLQNIDETLGTMDLTPFFTNFNGSVGPLLPGQWQITATSDIPEPASLLILAASLLGMGAYRRLKK